jgi:hypothetical protein
MEEGFEIVEDRKSVDVKGNGVENVCERQAGQLGDSLYPEGCFRQPPAG